MLSGDFGLMVAYGCARGAQFAPHSWDTKELARRADCYLPLLLARLCEARELSKRKSLLVDGQWPGPGAVGEPASLDLDGASICALQELSILMSRAEPNQRAE